MFLVLLRVCVCGVCSASDSSGRYGGFGKFKFTAQQSSHSDSIYFGCCVDEMYIYVYMNAGGCECLYVGLPAPAGEWN
jgi:hypothetical protein